MKDRDRYDSLFQWYAEHGAQGSLDWRAIKAQAIAESNLDPTAVSRVGAAGLMQFMPATWMEWQTKIRPGRTPATRMDAERSIEAGCAYMGHLLSLFGNLDTARAAYNWGIGNVKRHLAEHGGKLELLDLPVETQGYLARIARIYEEIA